MKLNSKGFISIHLGLFALLICNSHASPNLILVRLTLFHTTLYSVVESYTFLWQESLGPRHQYLLIETETLCVCVTALKLEDKSHIAFSCI